MPRRPRRDRLGPALFAAGGFAVLALLCWGVALVTAWGATCPAGGYGARDLAQGVSAWPPGAQCPGQHGDVYLHETLPALKWIAVALILAAALVFATGMFATLRDLRSAGAQRWRTDRAPVNV